jgi:hypothetical protein
VLFFGLGRRYASHGVVRAAAARVCGQVAENVSADFPSGGQTKARVRIIESGLNAGFFNEISSEMFAARGAHRVGFEKRAAKR